jgi:hypothetical protein
MQQKRLNNPIIALSAAFLACFLYWAYLFHSSMAVMFDAIAYEQVGEMIYKKGWIEYFKTGPNREPLYSASIAASMKFADGKSFSYQEVQKVQQLVLLFVTQLLTLYVLRKLRIRLWLQIAVILYIGFSPGLLNAALSLFSEIIIFPSVLGAAIILSQSWRSILNSQVKSVVIFSLLTAGVFILATLGKGIFQYVFAASMITIGILVIWAGYARMFSTVKNGVIFVLLTTVVYGAVICGFMSLNKKYNGQFEFTNRYANLLFGNAYKRTEPLSFRMKMAHVASIPGGGFCRRFFSDEECGYCEFRKADEAQSFYLRELSDGVPETEKKKAAIHQAFNRIKDHPVQFGFLMFLETLKMLFWESTQVGFVNYPPLTAKIYNNLFFKDILRLVMGVVTAFSFIYVLIASIPQSRGLLARTDEGFRTSLIFFMFLIIISYTGLYGLFSIVVRYALPLGPLFVILIAFMVESVLRQHRQEKKD